MKDKDRATEKMNMAVKEAEVQKQEKEDMKHELERKKWLAIQAIGARSSMKDNLESLQNEVKSLKEQSV